MLNKRLGSLLDTYKKFKTKKILGELITEIEPKNMFLYLRV